MGYQIYKLQNASSWDDNNPTIIIEKGDDLWDEAFANWISGKNPTNNPGWKRGVYAITRCK